MDIQQLPPSVINKIAAGEVIERPASVVKELVENSIDAGAKRVDVSIAKGGTELIRVTDNGAGIAPDQLGLAIASHATSKIRDADDLFQVMTMGFRGEALASIAEISQFTIRSRQAAETAGSELEVHGGVAGETAPCGCPVGTTIEVRNLFFNTPVRRKFMRTVQTEMGHITEALTRIALAHDDVHFTLTHNDRIIQDLPATENWRDRITSLFGQEIGESLIQVESAGIHVEATPTITPIQISGYVANPSQSRANNRMQYLFLNRRHIRDRALGHALGEAYRGLLMVGRYPIAFLRIEMPADAVDVNVHPTKLEVRFQNGGEVYSRLLRMLRTRFLSTDLTAKATSTPPAPPSASSTPSVLSANSTETGRPQGGGTPQQGGRSGFERLPASRIGGVPEFKPFSDSSLLSPRPPQSSFDPSSRNAPSCGPSSGGPSSGEPIRQDNFPLDFRSPASLDSASDLTRRSHGPFDGVQPSTNRADDSGTAKSESPTVMAEGTAAMQVYDRYLITESDEGVVVIDQHALHERIIYEELRTKVLSESVEVQKLLVPEPVTLTPSEKAAVMQERDELASLGVEVEEFGGDAVLISAYPAMLANINPTELLRGVVEQLMAPEKTPERRDLVDRLLHMISCKAAIKAGDRLTSEEIRTLVERRHTVQDSHHCPHGRPTTLVFSRDELDKMFGRTY